jgi:hypothetical protein
MPFSITEKHAIKLRRALSHPLLNAWEIKFIGGLIERFENPRQPNAMSGDEDFRLIQIFTKTRIRQH